MRQRLCNKNLFCLRFGLRQEYELRDPKVVTDSGRWLTVVGVVRVAKMGNLTEKWRRGPCVVPMIFNQPFGLSREVVQYRVKRVSVPRYKAWLKVTDGSWQWKGRLDSACGLLLGDRSDRVLKDTKAASAGAN